MDSCHQRRARCGGAAGCGLQRSCLRSRKALLVCVAVTLGLSLVQQGVNAFDGYSTLGDILHWYSHTAQTHQHVMRFVELKEPGFDHVAMPLAYHTNMSVPHTNKAAAIVVFGEHAREIITTEVGLWLSRVLVGDTAEFLQWAELPAAFAALGIQQADMASTLRTWQETILERLIVKLIPVENVEGRQAWEAGQLCLRKTHKGVDLNRNYPFAFQPEPAASEMFGGPHPLSEPQSRLITRMALEHLPKAYINVHSGEWAVYSPWDSKSAVGPGLPADLDTVLQRSGDICGCQAGPAGAVSNYLAYGTGMDFMYTQLGVPYALTYEVFGSGRVGALPPGAKNQLLSSFQYVEDPGIAKALPEISTLLPAVAHTHHLTQHSKARRRHSREAYAGVSAHRRRRAAGLRSAAVRNGIGLGQQPDDGSVALAFGLSGVLEQPGEGAAQQQHAAQVATAAAAAAGAAGSRNLKAAAAVAADRAQAAAIAGARAASEVMNVRSSGAGAGGDAAAAAAAGGVSALGGRSMRRLAAAAAAGTGASAAQAAGLADGDGSVAGGSGDGTVGTVGLSGSGRGLAQQQIVSVTNDGEVMRMVSSKPMGDRRCFEMFNPSQGAEYRDVVSRWVVMVLMTLNHVADPTRPEASPHPLPGTVLAGGGGWAAHSGRRLSAAGAAAAAAAAAAAGAAGGAHSRGSAGTETLLGGAERSGLGDKDETSMAVAAGRRRLLSLAEGGRADAVAAKAAAFLPADSAGGRRLHEALGAELAAEGRAGARAGGVHVEGTDAASAAAGVAGAGGQRGGERSDRVRAATRGRVGTESESAGGAGGRNGAFGQQQQEPQPHGSGGGGEHDLDDEYRRRRAALGAELQHQPPLYQVDPLLKQHSWVVLAALCCLGIVMLPFLRAAASKPKPVRRRPAP